MKYLYRAPA
ncbi:hypothetical protein Zm00014a_002477 [Zea mays]|uniref:Uncharacterized protein n=1 Tax=Zea mays TaxID=4577 RepID=A0A3L6FEH8_MAIZE|nr:hypothetical protein Zm00014a_002477 [Zea mays]